MNVQSQKGVHSWVKKKFEYAERKRERVREGERNKERAGEKER